MENNLSKEALEKLGIYELRNVARQVGVYSPTRYKKEVLIDKITSIVRGEEEPYIKKTNQGRPPKQIAGLDEILSIFVPNIEQKSQFEQRFHENLFTPAFMQTIKVLPDNFENFEGYLKLLPGNYGVVFKNSYFEGNKNTYYLTPQILTKIGLREGDYIKGICYFIDETKPKIIKEIQFVNGVNLPAGEKILREDFEKAEAVYPRNQIKISKTKDFLDFKCIDYLCPFGEGSRVAISYEKNFYIEDFVIEFVKRLSVNYDVSLIAVDERPEDLSLIRAECDKLTMLNKLSDLDEISFTEQTLMMFNHILRQVENGKNQVVVIKNFQKFESLLKRYHVVEKKMTDYEAKIQARNIIKRMFSLAKNTSKGYALTFIAFNCSSEELMDLSNCQIYFKGQPYDDTDIYLDCINSHTIKANLLFSEKDNERNLKFRKNLSSSNLISKLNDLLD